MQRGQAQSAPAAVRSAPARCGPVVEALLEVRGGGPVLRAQLVLLSVSGLLWLLWLLWKRLLHNQLSGSLSPHSPWTGSSKKDDDAGYPHARHWKKTASASHWIKED